MHKQKQMVAKARRQRTPSCRRKNFQTDETAPERTLPENDRAATHPAPGHLPTGRLTLPCAVMARETAVAEQAGRLARRLGLPLVGEAGPDMLLLRLDRKGLDLVRTGDPALTGAVQVEFVRGRLGYRRVRPGRQMLLRAVGVGKYGMPLVFDATGGLGSDAFLIAAAGCRVQLFERNPVVAALLEDGLRRAAADPAAGEICGRITLRPEEFTARSWQETGEQVRPQVVYLDPMFPARGKSARVKKGLQLLQLLVGEPGDTGRLLRDALDTATRRVVVKRPGKGPFLADRRPSFSLAGRTTRFDVYLLTDRSTRTGR